MMRVLFDLNVVLDLFLDRQPWSADAQRLVARVLGGTLGGVVSSTSIPTLYYIARRSVGAAQALVVVARTLQTFEVAAVGGSTLRAALALQGTDYEDLVQAAAAIENGVDAIVTRDRTGFAGVPVRVLTPVELEAELTAPPNP